MSLSWQSYANCAEDRCIDAPPVDPLSDRTPVEDCEHNGMFRYEGPQQSYTREGNPLHLYTCAGCGTTRTAHGFRLPNRPWIRGRYVSRARLWRTCGPQAGVEERLVVAASVVLACIVLAGVLVAVCALGQALGLW